MTVDIAHAPVSHFNDARCQGPSSVSCPASPHVIHIVCVHDPNHVPELLRVPPAMVEPCEMLWLLQDRHICLQHLAAACKLT